MKEARAMKASVDMVFKGELVLRQITTLKTDMQSALDHIDSLLIEFSEARALDPSFLQLLCQGHRAMDNLSKALMQAGHEVDGLVPTVQPEEYFRHVGCRHDCQDNCLWDR
jgi:hypothetical protein